MIFLVYAINYADRTNIGAVLPFIIDEFHINNFEAGAIASMFFLGYAVSQIPAGFFIAKRGTRGLVSLSIFGSPRFTIHTGARDKCFSPAKQVVRCFIIAMQAHRSLLSGL